MRVRDTKLARIVDFSLKDMHVAQGDNYTSELQSQQGHSLLHRCKCLTVIFIYKTQDERLIFKESYYDGV